MNFALESWGVKAGEPDDDGDIFTQECLDSIPEPDDGTTIFKGHSFNVPRDIVGQYRDVKEMLQVGRYSKLHREGKVRLAPMLIYEQIQRSPDSAGLVIQKAFAASWSLVPRLAEGAVKTVLSWPADPIDRELESGLPLSTPRRMVIPSREPTASEVRERRELEQAIRHSRAHQQALYQDSVRRSSDIDRELEAGWARRADVPSWAPGGSEFREFENAMRHSRSEGEAMSDAPGWPTCPGCTTEIQKPIEIKVCPTCRTPLGKRLLHEIERRELAEHYGAKYDLPQEVVAGAQAVSSTGLKFAEMLPTARNRKIAVLESDVQKLLDIMRRIKYALEESASASELLTAILTVERRR